MSVFFLILQKKENCKIFDYINPAYDIIYTYPIKRFQENSEFWFEIITEKDRSRIKQKIKEITLSHIDGNYDYRINTSDEKIKYLRTYIAWDKDTDEWYYLGETRDVTELRMLTNSYENLNIGVSIYNPETRKFPYVNKKICKIFEHTKEEFEQLTLDELNQSYEIEDPYIKNLVFNDGLPINGKPTTFSIRVNGKLKWLKEKRSWTFFNNHQDFFWISRKSKDKPNVYKFRSSNNAIEEIIGIKKNQLTLPCQEWRNNIVDEHRQEAAEWADNFYKNDNSPCFKDYKIKNPLTKKTYWVRDHILMYKDIYYGFVSKINNID